MNNKTDPNIGTMKKQIDELFPKTPATLSNSCQAKLYTSTTTNTKSTDPQYVIQRQEDHIRHLTNILEMPWYLKDKYGWPIEFQKGKGRMFRIICQNIRKVIG